MKRRQFFGTLAGMVAAPSVRCETMPVANGFSAQDVALVFDVPVDLLSVGSTTTIARAISNDAQRRIYDQIDRMFAR